MEEVHIHVTERPEADQTSVAVLVDRFVQHSLESRDSLAASASITMRTTQVNGAVRRTLIFEHADHALAFLQFWRESGRQVNKAKTPQRIGLRTVSSMAG